MFFIVSGIQSDIQKVLRHARKLPDKTTQFYKELNRLKRAAVCLGVTLMYTFLFRNNVHFYFDKVSQA
jgi:hypothetical protein